MVKMEISSTKQPSGPCRPGPTRRLRRPRPAHAAVDRGPSVRYHPNPKSCRRRRCGLQLRLPSEAYHLIKALPTSTASLEFALASRRLRPPTARRLICRWSSSPTLAAGRSIPLGAVEGSASASI